MEFSARAWTWEKWSALSALLITVGTVAGHLAAPSADMTVMALSVIGVRRGIRSNRPANPVTWRLVMEAVSLFLLADIVAKVQPLVTGRPLPYPSLADAANALGYVICLAAGVTVVRRRSKGTDPTALVDAGIVTGGIASLAWAFVIVPDLQDPASSSIGRGTNVFFDVLSMALVAIVVRLACGPGRRNGSWYWLASAVASALVSDLLLAVWSESGRSGTLVTVSNGLAAWACASLATASLHPGMGQLTEQSNEQLPPMSPYRLATMIGSALVAPVILLVHSSSQSFVFTVGVVMTWGVLCALIVLRMAGLVRARETMAITESIVRHASTAMVTAITREQLCGVAGQAAHRLLESAGLSGSVSVGFLRGQELDLQSIDREGRWTPGTLVLLSPSLVEAVESGVGSELFALDQQRLPEELRAPWVGLFPMRTQLPTRGLLAVRTSRPLPTPMISGCESLAHLMALSIEAFAAAAIQHQKAAEIRFQQLFEHSADIIAVLGRQGSRGFISPSAEHLLRLTPALLANVSLRELVHPGDLASFDNLVQNAELYGGLPVEIRLRCDGTSWKWFDVIARNLSSIPEVGSVVVTARDISDRRDADERLAGSERRFRSLVQNSHDIIGTIDFDGRITWVGESIRSILGFDPSEIVGRTMLSLVDASSQNALSAALDELGNSKASTSRTTVRISSSTGDSRAFALTLSDRRSDNAVGYIVVNARDVTDEISLQEDLRYRALHDDLTGLPNRVLLRDQVKVALKKRPTDGNLLAVLFIDVDDFKTVNDSLGHAVGDELLRQAAERLRTWCRKEDTPGRLGGDEFAVLIESASTEEEVIGISERLRDAFRAPFEVGQRRLTVAASVGVALSTTADLLTPDDLLRNADAAMYVAKSRGKDRVEVFEPSMHLQAFDRMELKEDLVRAVARHELRLYYQPLVELATGRISGYEALLRWQHPTRGLLPPMSFIPLAEETTLIDGIGWWALETAVVQLREWRIEGRDVAVAVNLSARQLGTEAIVVDVASLLRSTGIPPSCLTIELTESAVVGSEAILRLEALRALGIRIAADDFGTGVASYASLQQLPFTSVKIDKSLIDGLAMAGRAATQVRSIIEMAHKSDLTVVAEGIEQQDQATILAELGCDLGQGFLFGRPTPPEETTDADLRQLVKCRNMAPR